MTSPLLDKQNLINAFTLTDQKICHHEKDSVFFEKYHQKPMGPQLWFDYVYQAILEHEKSKRITK